MPPPVRAASPQDGEPDEPSPIGFEALKAELRKYSLPSEFPRLLFSTETCLNHPKATVMVA